MTGFNFFSHGTQDLYPTFLEAQHHLAPGVVSAISIVANLGQFSEEWFSAFIRNARDVAAPL